MNGVAIAGCGIVSPAGWGMESLRKALASNSPVPLSDLPRPGGRPVLKVRTVPAPVRRPDYLGNPRLRRASPISQHAVAAAVEALGAERAGVEAGKLRLGIIFCVMCGCVNYSRRFYDETLRDPATASPLVFPETVFNAPASHLANLLQATGMVYTFVGDPGTFIAGIAQAAEWITTGLVDRALVVGAEEMDWLTADAVRLFDEKVVMSHGAGAVYMSPVSENDSPDAPGWTLVDRITSPYLFTPDFTKAQAAYAARAELGSGPAGELLSDGLQNAPLTDAQERETWRDWKGARISVKSILGEGLTAAAAWQTVAAIDSLAQKQHLAATVSVVGCNEQAIAARFLPMGTVPLG